MATANLTFSKRHWSMYNVDDMNHFNYFDGAFIGGNGDATYTTIFEMAIPEITISKLDKIEFTLTTTGSYLRDYVAHLFSRSSAFESGDTVLQAINNKNEGWIGSVIASGTNSITFSFSFTSIPAVFSKTNNLHLVVHGCFKNYSGHTDGTIRQNYGWKDVTALSGTIAYTSYTKNKAPQVSIDESIGALNDTAQLRWSGAEAGTANMISGYTIYYKDGSVPTIASHTGKDFVGPDVDSYTVSISPTRGQTRYFRVVAESPYSGYSSDISSNNASIKTNQLPSAPSVSISNDSPYKQMVPSTGGTVIFKPKPGNSNDLNQTASVWYSTTLDGTKTQITTSTFSPIIEKKTTYYFWTHDGLEYSEKSFNITIDCNVKPDIIIGEIKTKEYISNDTTYISSLSIPLSFNKKQSKLTYTLNYIIDGQSKQTEKVVENVSETTTINLNINELLSEFYNNKKIEYYISFVITDSYESSDPVNIGTYALAAAPQIDTSKLPIEFYGSLDVLCSKDSEITSVSCEILKSDDSKIENLIYHLTSTDYQDSGKVSIVIDSILDVSTEIKIILKFSNGSFNKTTSFIITALKGYELQNFSINPFLIKPFSSPTGEERRATIEWPFQGEKVEEGCICGLRYVYNGEISEVTFDSNSIIRTSDSLTLNYEYNHCFNFYENGEHDGYGGALCGTNIYLRGTYQVQIFMFIDAGYAVFYSEPETLILDFEEVVKSINFSMGYIGDNGFVSFSNDKPLREGITPTFQLSFTQYTQAIPTINILKSSDNVNWTNYYSYTPKAEGFNYFVNNHYQSFSFPATSTFPEIDKVYSGINGDVLYFKVIIGVSSTLSEPPQIEVQARKFTSSEISIKTVEYDDDWNIKVGYTVKKGYGNDGPTTTKVKLIAEELEEPIVMEGFPKDLLNETQVAIINNNDNNKPLPSILSLHLEFTSTYTPEYGGISLTKTSSSSTFVKFSNAPTVSYRQNLIGINTSNIDNEPCASDSVLMIAQSSGKNYITLVGTSGEEKILGRIDLSTGALSGFTINGGTW